MKPIMTIFLLKVWREFKIFSKLSCTAPTKTTQFAKSELKVSWNSAKKVQVTEEKQKKVKGETRVKH